MPVHNTDVAGIFSKVADLLDIEGANEFRIRAYRNAARTIGDLPQSISDMVKEGKDPAGLPGIGKSLADKIKEIVKTGSLVQLQELEARTPPDLQQLMHVAGLGPRRIKMLYHKLGVRNLADLKQAAERGEIREVEGFGRKTEQTILTELEDRERTKEDRTRISLVAAERIAESYIKHLRQDVGTKEIVASGSYRRKMETVGDLDILVICKKGTPVMDRFVAFDDVKKVVSRGVTRSTVILRSGLQVDLRVVAQASYGAALHYFTGSKAHNIAIRKRGVDRDLKINEYGVFRGDQRIAGRTEEEVFEAVGLPFIEPELREGRGEIEAASRNELPDLITEEDMQGDLHIHTNVTDGRHSLEEMVHAAQDLGYEYVAITEHSKRVTVAHGLDERKFLQRIEEIEKLNASLRGITILQGVEVDILKDGSLDLPDDILKRLDLIVCSVHYYRNLSREKQTERILRAMDNPYFMILGHPTGRLIMGRPAYEVDMERIMEGLRDRGGFLELNAHPDRLDLSDINCKLAKEMGIKLAISTDAHSKNDLHFMRFGIYQARRGWIEPDDVINTRSLSELKLLLKEVRG